MWRQTTIAQRQTTTLTTMPASSARQTASNSVWSPTRLSARTSDEGDQRGAGAGAADAGLRARVLGDRDDRLGLRRRALLLALSFSLAIIASRGAQRLDLAVADVAHQPIFVGAGDRRPSECPSGPPPGPRARPARARSAAAPSGSLSSMRTSMPSGSCHLSWIRMPEPETSSVVVSPPTCSSTPRTVTSRMRGDAHELAPLDALDVAAERDRQRAAARRRRACPCSGGCRGRT